MSEDLPEPETPVTHTNSPSGISTSIFLRLFSEAFLITRLFPLPFRLSAGTSIFFLPERYCPVIDFLHLSKPSTLPL